MSLLSVYLNQFFSANFVETLCRDLVKIIQPKHWRPWQDTNEYHEKDLWHSRRPEIIENHTSNLINFETTHTTNVSGISKWYRIFMRIIFKFQCSKNGIQLGNQQKWVILVLILNKANKNECHGRDITKIFLVGSVCLNVTKFKPVEVW